MGILSSLEPWANWINFTATGTAPHIAEIYILYDRMKLLQGRQDVNRMRSGLISALALVSWVSTLVTL